MEASTKQHHQVYYERGIVREHLSDEQYDVLDRIWLKAGTDVTVGWCGPRKEGWIYAESGKHRNNGDGHVMDREGLYHFPGMPEGAKGIKPEDL